MTGDAFPVLRYTTGAENGTRLLHIGQIYLKVVLGLRACHLEMMSLAEI